MILDCDIGLGSRSSLQKDLAYTLMHELGHGAWALVTTCSDYGAVMGYSRSDRNYA